MVRELSCDFVDVFKIRRHTIHETTRSYTNRTPNKSSREAPVRTSFHGGPF